MSRKSNLVHAALAACAMFPMLSSTSWAAVINVPTHVVQAPGITTAPPAGFRGPKHFSSPTGHPSSGNNGTDHEGGGDSAFKDSRRGGQKSPGGGQPGEPWNR
jgi:hypothetical protein